MLSLILGFITGLAGPVSQVIKRIVDLKAQRVAAASNSELKRIDQELEEMQSKKAVLIAESGHRLTATLNALFRTFLALPAGFLMWKLYAYDKVWGSLSGCSGAQGQNFECRTFLTDPLTIQDWALISTVFGFYFLHMFTSRR